MQTKLDAAKAELLVKAAEAAEHSQVGGAAPGEGLSNGALTTYLHHYYLHTAPEDLVDRDPVDVYGAAASHYRLGLKRPQGTAEVRVSTPTVDENGWSSGHTVVEVITDDMPFLVDSVTNELSRQNRAIHLVIHPQLVVRRDITGKLLEILDVDACARSQVGGAEWPADATVESWMHIEIDRESDRTDLRAIEADLRRVLGDVREVVEDWAKMRTAALRLADELAEQPRPTCPSRRSARPGS